MDKNRDNSANFEGQVNSYQFGTAQQSLLYNFYKV